jgi:CBS domain-containing protein
VRSDDEAVRGLIRRPAVDVAPDATLRMVAETLRDESIGVVLVHAPHGTGLVSERDVVQAIAEGADPDRKRAEDVMTIDLALADPDEPVISVARRMLANEIRHLPVTDDGAIVGVISARDALEALVAHEDEPS